jgi:hypothetical protein
MHVVRKKVNRFFLGFAALESRTLLFFGGGDAWLLACVSLGFAEKRCCKACLDCVGGSPSAALLARLPAGVWRWRAVGERLWATAIARMVSPNDQERATQVALPFSVVGASVRPKKSRQGSLSSLTGFFKFVGVADNKKCSRALIWLFQ